MDVRPHSTKKELLANLLEKGMVLVAVDARAAEAEVPQHLKSDLQLRLNLSYRFGLPIELFDWGVAATLTFSGKQFACRLPWSAIFLMVSHVTGRPYLFPEDIPAELVGLADAAYARSTPATPTDAATPKQTQVTPLAPFLQASSPSPAARQPATLRPHHVAAPGALRRAEEEKSTSTGLAPAIGGAKGGGTAASPHRPRLVVVTNAESTGSGSDSEGASEGARVMNHRTFTKGMGEAAPPQSSQQPETVMVEPEREEADVMRGESTAERSEEPDGSSQPQRTPPRRGHLRLVK